MIDRSSLTRSKGSARHLRWLILHASIVAAAAHAGCGDMPGAPPQKRLGAPPASSTPQAPRMVHAVYVAGEPEAAAPRWAAIVGMWKFSFVAKGNPAPGPADGTVLDFGYATWHADGTELMNSGARPPQSGDFCMGVWKETAPGTFRLNHYGVAWQPDGSAYLGPANIKEEVTVSDGGRHYAGVFTIDQYDAGGKTVLGHVQGTVSATRVTIEGGGL
jgi:hypothetical protein